jgi:hypothetical protein
VSGFVDGGELVVVRGKGFAAAAPRCRFGSGVVPAVFVSPTELLCAAPPLSLADLATTGGGGGNGSSGAVAVRVSNDGASWSEVADVDPVVFIYQRQPAVALPDAAAGDTTTPSPLAGEIAGGNTIFIRLQQQPPPSAAAAAAAAGSGGSGGGGSSIAQLLAAHPLALSTASALVGGGGGGGGGGTICAIGGVACAATAVQLDAATGAPASFSCVVPPADRNRFCMQDSDGLNEPSAAKHEFAPRSAAPISVVRRPRPS